METRAARSAADSKTRDAIAAEAERVMKQQVAAVVAEKEKQVRGWDGGCEAHALLFRRHILLWPPHGTSPVNAREVLELQLCCMPASLLLLL
jgi:hypothetical protein